MATTTKSATEKLPDPVGSRSDVATQASPTSANQSSGSGTNGGQPPEVTFRVGRVSCSCFINSSQQRGRSGEDYTWRFRTVTLQRSYKAEDGSTKYVSSFGLGEIYNAIRVLQLAAEHLESKEAKVAD